METEKKKGTGGGGGGGGGGGVFWGVGELVGEGLRGGVGLKKPYLRAKAKEVTGKGKSGGIVSGKVTNKEKVLRMGGGRKHYRRKKKGGI